MELFLLTALFFTIFIAAMSIGTWFTDRELKGSCGGPQRDEDGNVTCCQDASKVCDQAIESSAKRQAVEPASRN